MLLVWNLNQTGNWKVPSGQLVSLFALQDTDWLLGRNGFFAWGCHAIIVLPDNSCGQAHSTGNILCKFNEKTKINAPFPVRDCNSSNPPV